MMRRKKMTFEDSLAECQKEIRRLREALREDREQMKPYEGVEILKVKANPGGSGKLIGDVVTEMWEKALALKAQELSFEFNSHTITIRSCE
jgi:hypothetical protein